MTVAALIAVVPLAVVVVAALVLRFGRHRGERHGGKRGCQDYLLHCQFLSSLAPFPG